MSRIDPCDGIVCTIFKVLKERFRKWRIESPLEYEELLNEVQLDSPSLEDSWIGFWKKDEQFMFRIKLIEGLSGKPINIERSRWDNYCKLHDAGSQLTIQIQHSSCVYTWDQNDKYTDGMILKIKSFSITEEPEIDDNLLFSWMHDPNMKLTIKLLSVFKMKFSKDLKEIVIPLT